MKVNMFIPKYMLTFKCIGSACTDTCCAGWDINIDEDTYEKYKDLDFTAKNFNVVIELINKARKNEGIDITPLRNMLEKNINEEAIRKSNIITITLLKFYLEQFLQTLRKASSPLV